MLKKIKRVAALIISVAFLASCTSMMSTVVPTNLLSVIQPDPRGFRGFPWGTPIKDINFEVTRTYSGNLNNADISLYSIDDMMSSRSISNSTIHYELIAMDGKLIAFMASGLPNESMTALLDDLTARCGNPTLVIGKMKTSQTHFNGEANIWYGEHGMLGIASEGYKNVFVMADKKGMMSLGRKMNPLVW